MKTIIAGLIGLAMFSGDVSAKAAGFETRWIFVATYPNGTHTEWQDTTHEIPVFTGNAWVCNKQPIRKDGISITGYFSCTYMDPISSNWLAMDIETTCNATKPDVGAATGNPASAVDGKVVIVKLQIVCVTVEK